MRITKDNLRRIIREELGKQITEADKLGPDPAEGDPINPQTRAKIEALPFSGEIPVFAKKDGAVVQTDEKMQWNLKLEGLRYWKRRLSPSIVVAEGTLTYTREGREPDVNSIRLEPFELLEDLQNLNSKDPKVAFKQMTQSTFIWQGPRFDPNQTPEEKKAAKELSAQELGSQIGNYMSRYGDNDSQWGKPTSREQGIAQNRAGARQARRQTTSRYEESKQMKITKEQLKQIIKEEIRMVMNEEMEGAVESDIRIALSSDEMSFEDLIAAVPDARDSEELQDSLFYLLQKGDVEADEEIDMEKMENEVWTENDPEWSNVFFKSSPSLQEQEDANQQIDKAQVEAQKIAGKLASELEKVSEVSGLDIATLASLVSQFIDQEIK